MDVQLLNPFITAFFNVLPQLGFQTIKRGQLALKDKLLATGSVTVLIGVTRDVRGNLAISMDETTARKAASLMMMGMPVSSLDEMAQSAIVELANMLAGNAMADFEAKDISMNISPPTLIMGDHVYCVVSEVQTLAVEILTEAGSLELNLGLEV
jgi:chemotaxis protein CheX